MQYFHQLPGETPPRHYGPWERVVSLLTEGLVKEKIDVTLYATGDSLTSAKLRSICKTPYEEDKNIDPKVCECLHISEIMEQADEFDIIHNNYDFLPLTYSRLIKTPIVTTIHGFSSPKILPVYKKYNKTTHYVSISYTDRSPELDYIRNVYHGIDINNFTLNEDKGLKVNQNSRVSGHENSRPQDKKITPYHLLCL